ncbi:hypothetical protein ACTFIY_004585 [Dictyostelium cf. discoideum]
MGFLSSIGSKVSGMFNVVKSKASSIINMGGSAVKHAYTDIIKPIILTPKNLVDGVVSVAKTGAETVKTGVSNITQGMGTGIVNVSKGVEGLGTGIGGGIAGLGSSMGMVLPVVAAGALLLFFSQK